MTIPYGTEADKVDNQWIERAGTAFIDIDPGFASEGFASEVLAKELLANELANEFEIEAEAKDFATSCPSGFKISICLDQLLPILARSPSQNWPVYRSRYSD